MMRVTLILLSVASLAGCVRDLPEHELGLHALAIFRDFDTGPMDLPSTLEAMDVAMNAIDALGKIDLSVAMLRIGVTGSLRQPTGGPPSFLKNTNRGFRRTYVWTWSLNLLK